MNPLQTKWQTQMSEERGGGAKHIVYCNLEKCVDGDEGVTWQGEVFLCVGVCVCVCEVHICQTAGCEMQVSLGFGAACHLVNKQQLFIRERRD